MPELEDGIEQIGLASGRYVYDVIVATGPVIIEVSSDGGVSYKPMTGGSFAASDDGTIIISRRFRYKATVPGGDSISIELSDPD